MVISTLPQDLEYFSMKIARSTSEIACLLLDLQNCGNPAYARLYNIFIKIQTLDEDFYKYTQEL